MHLVLTNETIAIILTKSKSERIPGKFKKDKRYSFLSIFIKENKKCNFDEVYIDTDNNSIKNWRNKK